MMSTEKYTEKCLQNTVSTAVNIYIYICVIDIYIWFLFIKIPNYLYRWRKKWFPTFWKQIMVFSGGICFIYFHGKHPFFNVLIIRTIFQWLWKYIILTNITWLKLHGRIFQFHKLGAKLWHVLPILNNIHRHYETLYYTAAFELPKLLML